MKPSYGCKCPRGIVQSAKDKFEVFYIGYGNQEAVAYNQLRPTDPSWIGSTVPTNLLKGTILDEDHGYEAATLTEPKEFKAVIEEKDTSGGKVKGREPEMFLC